MKQWLVLWVLSLVLVAMATFAVAQTRLAQPTMLSGNDIGFRVEGTGFNGKPTGTWMVRINGTWTEVASGVMRPATN